MLNFLSKYLALVLMILGVLLVVLRIALAKIRAEKLTETGKRQLWFTGVLGAWCVVIGVGMVVMK